MALARPPAAIHAGGVSTTTERSGLTTLGPVEQLCAGRLDAMVDRLEVSRKGLQQRMTQLGIE